MSSAASRAGAAGPGTGAPLWHPWRRGGASGGAGSEAASRTIGVPTSAGSGAQRRRQWRRNWWSSSPPAAQGRNVVGIGLPHRHRRPSGLPEIPGRRSWDGSGTAGWESESPGRRDRNGAALRELASHLLACTGASEGFEPHPDGESPTPVWGILKSFHLQSINPGEAPGVGASRVSGVSQWRRSRSFSPVPGTGRSFRRSPGA